jgi:hypothetical protein
MPSVMASASASKIKLTLATPRLLWRRVPGDDVIVKNYRVDDHNAVISRAYPLRQSPAH